MVATYTLESCTGGNDYRRFIGVFYEDRGQIGEFRYVSAQPTGVVGATVFNGQINVQMKHLGPNDARCCPSVSRNATYKLADGRLIQTR